MEAYTPEDLRAGEQALWIPSVLYGKLASFSLWGVSMVLDQLGVSWRPLTACATNYKL